MIIDIFLLHTATFLCYCLLVGITKGAIDGMLDLYLDGMLGKAALYAKTERLQQECESCRSLLKNIDIIPSVPRAALVSFLLASRDSLASDDAALQRRVLLTFVEDIA